MDLGGAECSVYGVLWTELVEWHVEVGETDCDVKGVSECALNSGCYYSCVPASSSH